MKTLFTLLISLCTLQAIAQEHITLYFNTGKDTPTGESEKEFAAWLGTHKNAEITSLHGHADAVGTDESNKDLSRRRAEHVSAMLQQAGFPPEWEIKATGEEQSQTGPDAGNRKVTVWYTPGKEPAAAAPAPQPATEPVQIKQRGIASQIQSARKGDRLELKNVGFAGGTDNVLNSSQDALLDLLQAMKDMPSLRIEIQGHICCFTMDYDGLSLKRAKAVYSFLVQNGIDKSRLSYKGFGGSRPIYMIPEFNEEHRQANRRVEIQIVEL